MIETISISFLIAIGILFIGLEVLLFSFVLFFFGLGFLAVALLSFFYSFDNGLAQIAIASTIALLLAFALRKYLMQRLSKTNNKPETRVHVAGIGFVEDGMVKFDGTYWECLDDVSAYKDGDKVEVIDVVDNRVILKKGIVK